ncbi:polymer-forming cytoskeletal protein [Nesterenkonia populi]
MTRAAVQSSAAAEAGVESATNHVAQGCNSTTLTGTDPEYAAEIRFSTAEDPHEVDWDSVPLGCPEAADGWVHVRALGESSAEGLRNSAGDEQAAEAVYEWIAPETPEERLGNVAMYAVSTAQFNINLLPHESSNGDIIIRERSITRPVTCRGATIPGSLIVESNQSVVLREGCQVNGDVETGGNLTIEAGDWRRPQTRVHGDVLVTGRLELTDGRVDGNVRVHDQTVRPPEGRQPNSNSVASNAAIGGRFSIPQDASLNTAGGCMTGGGWWGGREDTSLTGQLCGLQQRGQVGSTRELERRSQVDVIPPGVMEWNSFNPTVSDFEDIGYQAVTFSGGQCNNTGNAVRNAINTGNRVVIDALGCSDGIRLEGSRWNNYNLQLRNHVVFLTDHLYMNNVNISSQGNRSYQLFAIGPDEGGNREPTCDGGSFRLNQNVRTATHTPMMLFSPCDVTIGSNNDFSGQIYAGRYEGVDTNGTESRYTQRPTAMDYDLLPGLPMDLDSRDRLPEEPYLDLESGPVYYRDVMGDS